MGNLVEVIDATGHSTKYIYDSLGNLKEVHQYRSVNASTINSFRLSSTSTTEGAITVTGVVYGQNITTNSTLEANTVTQAVYQNPVNLLQGVNPSGVYEITAYEYDKRGLLTKVKDPLGKVTHYEYDGNGNLISAKDREG